LRRNFVSVKQGKMVKNIKTALSLVIALFPALFFSQEIKQMTANEVAELAVQNHQQLKVSAQNIDIAKQNTECCKTSETADITASTSQFYLGDAVAIDKDFSNSTNVPMPHYGSSYAVQATQLIFKGGLVNKSIEMAGLREQLSKLDLEKNKQDVKFLVISNYLDVYKILNQQKVFQNNKKLAQERLKNIQKFYQQGMVTRNEVIRGELAIKNLDQGILTLKNNKKILNYNLSIALGLPTDTEIIP
jgi:outer membrane protein TolC